MKGTVKLITTLLDFERGTVSFLYTPATFLVSWSSAASKHGMEYICSDRTDNVNLRCYDIIR